ncbi:MAG TPA: hypothetical protein VJA21_22950 [Verrucomicrobiae bacterium]
MKFLSGRRLLRRAFERGLANAKLEEVTPGAQGCRLFRTQLARPGMVILAVSCCVMLTSCSTSKASRAKADAELLRLTGFWQPCQIYLQASPHQRLYVEVDAVEGCSPSDETLDKLRNFLATHCQKPGGIEIVRSDVIPRKRALGMLPSALARKHVNGPPETIAGGAPAFLYVLYYDDILSDRPVVVETGHPGARAAKHLRLTNRNPHVDMLPYPAMIYMNAHWSPKSLHDEALLHEAGHVLGLAFRAGHASMGHCQSRPCLMTGSVSLTRFFLGLDPGIKAPLCERCLAQLAESRAQPPPSNVRFVGPVLVRSETGYQVLSLPHRAKVIVGDLSDRDCGDFAAAVGAEAASPGDSEAEWSAGASGKDELLNDPGKLSDVLTRLSADPDRLVRRVGPRLWTACAGQYTARGQFTNAVQACQKAILADAEDYQGYNLLGWIKATCPDASIRDGREAIAAATKACELTRWKEGNWIDTLAAACAEAGDFKRAIKFEERALRTGQPAESDQKGMRERLALYHQARPFREKH